MCLRDSMDDRLVALLEDTHRHREREKGGDHPVGGLPLGLLVAEIVQA